MIRWSAPALLLFGLVASASADPIIVKPDHPAIAWDGNAGQVQFADLRDPIELTSTEHLRTSCWWQDGAGFAATNRGQAVDCITQTVGQDGLYRYVIDLRSFQGRCDGRVQPDAEAVAGGLIGLWLVVDFGTCAGLVSMPDNQPHQSEPLPTPEPRSLLLLGAGLLALFFVKARR